MESITHFVPMSLFISMIPSIFNHFLKIFEIFEMNKSINTK